MIWKNKVINRIYDFFSGDRTCPNCKYLKKEPHALDRFISISTGRRHPVRMIKKCSLDNSVIRDDEVNTRNCRYFKRKYGSAPVIRKIRRFRDWTEEQWKCHHSIIAFLVIAVISIVGIVVTYLLAKGLL